MPTRMHRDEIEVDEQLVRGLLADQFPQWSQLSLRPAEPRGTDHTIFRLGEELSVRLPRVGGRLRTGSKELEWLPKLARALAVDIPVPLAEGRPARGYPWHWEVHTWVDGATVAVERIDTIRAAHDLVDIIGSLQRLEIDGAPPGRGVPLAERDKDFRYWLTRFDGDSRVVIEWERALATTSWQRPPVWHHGDLDGRNWLIRDGRITGLIDWGCMGIGDPACDLMVAWKLHSPEAYWTFREAMPADEPTWVRARGWVISQAVAILAYYTRQNNPILFHEAESWLELALSTETS